MTSYSASWTDEDRRTFQALVVTKAETVFREHESSMSKPFLCAPHHWRTLETWWLSATAKHINSSFHTSITLAPLEEGLNDRRINQKIVWMSLNIFVADLLHSRTLVIRPRFRCQKCRLWVFFSKPQSDTVNE